MDNEVKQRRGLLKKILPVQRSEKRKLQTLALGLREEFNPQTPFEEFLVDKLVVDVCRLSKLYAFEQKSILAKNNLSDNFEYGTTDKFIRYKNNIENDIQNTYKRLKMLKQTRKTRI